MRETKDETIYYYKFICVSQSETNYVQIDTDYIFTTKNKEIFKHLANVRICDTKTKLRTYTKGSGEKL